MFSFRAAGHVATQRGHTLTSTPGWCALKQWVAARPRPRPRWLATGAEEPPHLARARLVLGRSVQGGGQGFAAELMEGAAFVGASLARQTHARGRGWRAGGRGPAGPLRARAAQCSASPLVASATPRLVRTVVWARGVGAAALYTAPGRAPSLTRQLPMVPQASFAPPSSRASPTRAATRCLAAKRSLQSTARLSLRVEPTTNRRKRRAGSNVRMRVFVFVFVPR